MKKIATLMLMAILAMSLSGCYYFSANLDFKANGDVSISRVKGVNREFFPDETRDFEVTENGNVFACANQTPVNFNVISNISYDIWDSLLKTTIGGTEYKFGSMSVEYHNPMLENGTLDVNIEVEIFDGFSVLQIIDKYYNGGKRDPVRKAEYEAADEHSKQEMLKSWSNVHNMTLNLPFPVTQLEGSSDYVVISDKSLYINVGEILQNGGGKFKFISTGNPIIDSGELTTENNVVEIEDKVAFSDVNQGDWYYDAVIAAQQHGLVNGYGNGNFGPNDSLTIAQFCKILTNYLNLETYIEGDHWAFGNVYYCYELGYVLSEDAFLNGNMTNTANFDNPINRSQAIYGLSILAAEVKQEKISNLESSEIPDFSQIDPKYAENILEAYRYGLTTGVDISKKFNPEDSLTRAQLCQLFYNMNWI